LRRAPPIAQYVVASALEALGADRAKVETGEARLGVVICTMCGCVTYSRRFYDEALHQPSTASPLLFPETVFNAPGSHLASILNASGPNYTAVGDQGSFGVGMAMAVDWLVRERVDSCLLVGAEELDWTMADAMGMFSSQAIMSEGAGALYLRLDRGGTPGTRLAAISSAHLYRRRVSREDCVRRMRVELPALAAGELLCDGLQGASRLDAAEAAVWRDWVGARVSPRALLGEGLVASAAWQSVLAVDAVSGGRYPAATVSLVGCNEQATGIRFEMVKRGSDFGLVASSDPSQARLP
jgi:3-oxoacyl-(acyl-carrier-protein) synthase